MRPKGIDDNAPPLTYTGPSEDGSAQVQRQSGNGGPRHAAEQARTSRSASGNAGEGRKAGRSASSGPGGDARQGARMPSSASRGIEPIFSSRVAGPMTGPTSRGPACRPWSALVHSAGCPAEKETEGGSAARRCGDPARIRSPRCSSCRKEQRLRPASRPHREHGPRAPAGPTARRRGLMPRLLLARGSGTRPVEDGGKAVPRRRGARRSHAPAP